MKNRALLSVVVPVHMDRPEFRSLLRALLSARDSVICEVIVSDTSSLGLDLSDLESQYGERLKHVELPKVAPGPARNAGLQLASGRWILFVDSDDFVDVRTLDALRELGESLHATPFVSFGFSWKLQSGQRIFGPCSTLEQMILASPSSFWRHVYSTEALRETGVTFPGGLIAEDLVFLSRLAAIGDHPIPISETMYFHTQSMDSTSRVRDSRWLELPNQLVLSYEALVNAGKSDLWRVIWRRNALSGLLSTPLSMRFRYMLNLGLALRAVRNSRLQFVSVVDLFLSATRYTRKRFRY